MTGTIKSLDVASASGVITAEDGLIVVFCPSAVPAYDLPSFTVGQVVSFDLEPDGRTRALNVVVQRTPQAVIAPERRLEPIRLRYVGFEHRGSKRAYLFEGLAPGTLKRTFTVDADLTLFARHHVGMQEGPALCLRLLAAELDSADANVWTSLQCSLTDREMLVYLASRPIVRAKQGAKRTLPASGDTSDVR